MNRIILLLTLTLAVNCQYLVRNPLLEVQMKNLTNSKIGSISTVNYNAAVESVSSLLQKQEDAFAKTR